MTTRRLISLCDKYKLELPNWRKEMKNAQILRQTQIFFNGRDGTRENGKEKKTKRKVCNWVQRRARRACETIAQTSDKRNRKLDDCFSAAALCVPIANHDTDNTNIIRQTNARDDCFIAFFDIRRARLVNEIDTKIWKMSQNRRRKRWMKPQVLRFNVAHLTTSSVSNYAQ